MRAQVSKWGNSLALRIPGHLARDFALQEGSAIEITVDSGRIIVTRADQDPVYDLQQLIDGITDENRHAEISSGAAVGNEFS